MTKRRAVSKMLTMSDGYWGFVHKKRFYRWLYASLTFFAIFAVVVAFFDVGAGTSHAAKFVASKYTQGELDENQRLLQWMYVFYPTPFVFSWFLVYFAKFLFCWKIKRLRKARNYKYNLMLASLLVAVFYAVLLKSVLKMTLYSGPKLRSAVVIGLCELGLVGIEVFDERKLRKERHGRKKLLRGEQSAERQTRGQQEQKADGSQDWPLIDASNPVGML
uniref:RxLR effector candidate protein n=1 Tax=Peronospora matthiolae TaxID=2874970 RepID=A0AAV1UG30_9STRA